MHNYPTNVAGQPDRTSQRGNGGSADWVMLVILYGREREAETDRSVLETLTVMGPIRDILALDWGPPQASTE